MPVLKVIKNGNHLCTIGSDDVWAFSANMSMDIWGPEVSSLDVSGGSKRNEKGESTFLIWELSHELALEDQLVFSFEDGSRSAPSGRLFAPEDSAPAKADSEAASEEPDLKEMDASSAANLASTWTVSKDGAPNIKVKPDAERQHLMLHLIWNEDNAPDELNIKLAKKSYKEIMENSSGEIILSQSLPLGSQLQIAVGH